MTVLAGMIAASLTAHATVITFDAADGYADGNLNGQPSGGTYEWDASNISGTWKVVDGSAQITSDTPGFLAAVWTESLGGTTITQSANLTFTRTVESPTDFANGLFYVGISNLATQGGKTALVGIQQMEGNDLFRLQFRKNVGDVQDVFSGNFSGAALGLTAGGEATTDLLTLDVVHTYNGNDSWTTIAGLHNGATEVATLSGTWSAESVEGGWSDADKYLTLTAGNINNTTGVTVNFDQVSISAIPEPSMLGLLLVAFSAGVLRRRRA